LNIGSKAVFAFLKENGTSYGRDFQWATGLSSAALNRALQQLADRGLVGCENYQAFVRDSPSSDDIKDNKSRTAKKNSRRRPRP